METILKRFYRNATEYPESPAFLIKSPGSSRWVFLKWREVLGYVQLISSKLKSLGVKKGDYVAIFSKTRFEWTLIDVAVMSIGAVTVPIYDTLGSDQISYIINHSRSKVIFIEDPELLRKIEAIESELTHVDAVVLIEGQSSFKNTLSLADVLDGDAREARSNYQNWIGEIIPDDVATCVYTSGTTGDPKGALLTHANIIGEVDGLSKILRFGRDEIGLLFLPLAHVIARAMQFYQLSMGCVSAYAESIEKLGENIREIRPHFMAVVPRIMEKIYEKIIMGVEGQPLLRRKIFSWGVKIGKDVSQASRRHQHIRFLLALKYWLARQLIFGKIHERMGGRLKMVVSGGAPLERELAEFFHAVGLLIVEGYGLTETMAAIFLNRPNEYKFGTVGKPLDSVDVKLADDGEILVKGPMVFRGYKEPVGTADASSFEDGWFKTGDIGEFSRDGFLRITDRKKEIIVTAAGKNVAPMRVEGILKSSRFISDVVIYGDRRKYLTAILTINLITLEHYAKESGWSYNSVSELAGCDKTYELIKFEIECKNRLLARHETVKKFVILDHNFSQETGELTPTMKLKRKQIYEKYKGLIEEMYN